MAEYTGTPPTFLAGDTPPATSWAEVTNFMNGSAGVWTTTTPPVWTANVGTPALGNGTLTGRYRLIGKTKDFQFRLIAGSTTTFGTAGTVFFWTLPGGGLVTGTFMGSGWFFDAAPGTNYPLIWKIDSASSTLRTWRTDGTELTNTAPVTMAVNDQIMCSGTVEIA